MKNTMKNTFEDKNELKLQKCLRAVGQAGGNGSAGVKHLFKDVQG